MDSTGIVILAAGASVRLGRPKQLLLFRQKTLLQHVVSEALAAGLHPVVVVTGANAGAVAASVDFPGVEPVFNANWEQGKGSGIVAGVQKMLALQPGVQHIMLAVCDQPFVSADLFGQLVQTQKQSLLLIVASAYAGTLGTPVLFSRPYFDRLLALKGDQGAKQLLLQAHPETLGWVDFPQGHIDIDTEADFEGLA